MELVLDEFIINWHLSNVNNERETAESIIRIAKKKCHKLVFDCAYLDRFRAKLRDVRRQRKGDTYTMIVLVKRIGGLLSNSKKSRVGEGQSVSELNSIKDHFDRLVVKSALYIQAPKKLFVTTDQALIDEAKALNKYGIEGVTPDKAQRILMSS